MFDDRTTGGSVLDTEPTDVGRSGVGVPNDGWVGDGWPDRLADLPLVVVDRAAQLDSEPPGPWLAALLERLNPQRLAGDAVVAYIGACERQAAWAQSRQLEAIRELAHRRPPVARCELAGPDERTATASVSRFAADEVAAELRISRRGAEQRIGLALAVARLPLTRAAFANGRLDLVKVRAIETTTDPLGDDAAAAAEARVMPRAPGQLLGSLRESLARAVAAVDPASAEERHQRHVQERTVELVPLSDGMAGVWMVLRAHQAMAF